MVGMLSNYFIRHGERKEPVSMYDNLTEYGIKEMRDIGNKLDLDVNNSALFVVDNYRSKLSAVLLLYPNMSLGETEHMITGLCSEERISVREFLNYRPPNGTDSLFKTHLQESSEQKKVLKFMVDNSDKIAGSEYRRLSTYKSASEDFATEILSTYQDSTFQHRVYMGRETLVTSFRARITELTKGYNAMRDYVDWYGENIERDEKCNKVTGILTCRHDDPEGSWLWHDDYSTLAFQTRHLREIQKPS